VLSFLTTFAIATPLVIPARSHDISSRLRDLPALRAGVFPEHDEPAETTKGTRSRLGFDPVLQRTMLMRAPSPSISFDGIGPATSSTNGNPPDANAAIGPQHVLEVTNSLLAVFDKSGRLLYGPAATSTPWQGFGGLCGRIDRGDPVALYDRLADRWVISHMAWDNAFSAGAQCVAVSTSPDPLGAWSRYEFPFPSMNDAGKIGLWPDAYVFTTMLFDDGHARVCALDRIRMLSGSDASQQCFVVPADEEQPIPADLDGARPPAAGAPAWLLSRPFVEALGVYRLHVDWQQPSASSLSARVTVPVAHWDSPDCAECIPQPSTGQHLIAGVGGLGQRIVYRNLGDHEALLVSHAVDAGNGIVGIRWYELRPDASETLAVFQQGTFAADANHRWLPGVAMDGAGNIAIGYSVASESLPPSIRYAARLAGDPPGVLTLGEASLYESAESQTWSPRWGDYSSMRIDPGDDCTFWYTAEYPSQATPATRISAFRLPGCGVENDLWLSMLPSLGLVAAGGSVEYQIVTAGLAVSGSISLSVTGLPPGTSGRIEPASVIAGESATLTVVASADALATPSATFTISASGASVQARAVAQLRVHRDDAPPHDVDAGLPNGPAPSTSPSGCGCSSSQAPMEILSALFLGHAWMKRARRARARNSRHVG
jgi:MYXO-CTERM domain-containing protein